MKSEHGFTLVDTDGNAWIICGVFVQKNQYTYGYDLCVELMNGKTQGIAYSMPEEGILPRVRDVIAKHMAKNDGTSLDLRGQFRAEIKSFGSYGATILLRESSHGETPIDRCQVPN